LTCVECGHEFDVRRDLCPSCGHLNRAGATFCSHCQAGLRSDAVERIIEARGKSRREWRAERHAVAVEQKKREVESSQTRMEEFWAKDRARREAFTRARAEAAKRERRTLLIVGIVGAVIVLLLIVVSLILTFVLPSSESGDKVSLVPATQSQARIARASIKVRGMCGLADCDLPGARLAQCGSLTPRGGSDIMGAPTGCR